MALSRQEEIDYLNKHGFSADFTKLKYSYNVGLWGTSISVSYTHLTVVKDTASKDKPAEPVKE